MITRTQATSPSPAVAETRPLNAGASEPGASLKLKQFPEPKFMVAVRLSVVPVTFVNSKLFLAHITYRTSFEEAGPINFLLWFDCRFNRNVPWEKDRRTYFVCKI